MTPAAAVAVALVVWAIGLIRPVRVRALVYSLPIPMSLVLAGGTVHVDGVQVVGVLLLVGFFALTAVLHVRLGWPAVVAVVAAAGCYVAVAWALPARLPLLPCLLAVGGMWLAGLLLRPPLAANAPVRPVRSWPVALVRLGAVLVATFGVTWVAGLLGGLVVTFPYSGVLVAVEVRRDLVAFTWAFARNAVALVAFVAGYAVVQEQGVVAGLLTGWAAFAAVAVAVRLGVPVALLSAR